MFIPIWIPDPDLDFYPSQMTDPGVKKAPDPGSAILPIRRKELQVLSFGSKKLFQKSRKFHMEIESPNGGFYRGV
jgi:hypothetical protein